jgi:hypothetical protein
VVTAAVVVNTLGVYLAPRNATRVTREDLKRQTDHPLTRQRIRERDDQTF